MANLLYNTCVILHPCYITLKGVILQFLSACYIPCYMICYLTCYESCRKSCANQASFLGPFVGGGRVAAAGSAMHLQLIRCGGRTVVQRAQPSCLPPSCSKLSIVVSRVTAIAAGFEVAALPALCGALHNQRPSQRI